MARAKVVAGRKPVRTDTAIPKVGIDAAYQRAEPDAALLAFSVEQFCRLYGGISPDMFYKMRREGRGPVIMKVGVRTLISREAAETWRRACEAEAVAAQRQHKAAAPSTAPKPILAKRPRGRQRKAEQTVATA